MCGDPSGWRDKRAGTHELEEIFTRQALELEQWRSRFHAGQALPGISEQEAAEIVHSELGLELSQRKIQSLISKSRITDCNRLVASLSVC